MGANVTISAKVVHADGTPFYDESHAWYDVPPEDIAWFETNLAKASDHAAQLAKEPKADDGSFTATFKATLGDSVQPDVVFTNISYDAVVKQERFWMKISDDLVRIGEKRAKEKKKG